MLLVLAGTVAGRTVFSPLPRELEPVVTAWDLLHDNYVDAEHLDPVELAHGAISGMADAVGDTGHTYFLDPEDAAANQAFDDGAYVGIGVELNDTTDPTRVTHVVPGAPAATGGLELGDRIMTVDGQRTDGPDGWTALDAITGQAGTTVDLGVEHKAGSDILQLRLTREEVDADPVRWTMVPKTSIALIELVDFSGGSADDLRAAVTAAEAEGATGIVLDLRGNTGGLEDECLKAAGVFLEPGTAVLVEVDRSGARTSDVVPDGQAPTHLPLMTLVDVDTTSAPEALMGALQDADRGRVIGTHTFGTGTIVTDYYLDDGSDMLIGSWRWFTPNGRSAWHEGLQPDVEVALPAGDRILTVDEIVATGAKSLRGGRDAQLQRALKLVKKGP